jgi:hypothetical protein
MKNGHDLVVPARVARWFVFQTKNPNLGKFWKVSHWNMLVYCMDTWSILLSFVIYYGRLVNVVRGNLVYFSRFGICTKKNLATLVECNYASPLNRLWPDSCTKNYQFVDFCELSSNVGMQCCLLLHTA